MLSQLYHNRAILFATGPRGSSHLARTGEFRKGYYEEVGVAFKLARAMGLIRDKYFSIEENSINFRVTKNLVIIRQIAFALDQLLKEKEGILSSIENGKIYYKEKDPKSGEKVTSEKALKLIFDRLKRIRGYGEIDEETVMKNLRSRTIWEMLAPEGSRAHRFQFIKTWGFYSVLLSHISIDMAAARHLSAHKKIEAEKASASHDSERVDTIRRAAEKEARGKDIEEIKRELQADTKEEIPVAGMPDGAGLPDYTFAISDVHLREYHHENSDELLRLIWMVKRLNGRLIINGDFFDVWRAKGLDRAWVNNSRIVNALTKLREVVLVAGNHDEFLAKLAKRGGYFLSPNIKVVNEYRYPGPAGHLRFLHGHQFDRFNRPGAVIGRWVTRLVTSMEMSRLRRVLEALNSVTRGAFSSLVNILYSLAGPNLSARLLLIPKLIMPTSYLINRRLESIMDWLKAEVNKENSKGGVEFSQTDPFNIFVGHLHYEGISFFSAKVRAAVEKEFNGKVRLVITDSWDGVGEYVGDYICITDEKKEGRLPHIKKEVWTRTRD
jgi:UDP-2,3-diacylglucosamine pyrophosphatase LpxH